MASNPYATPTSDISHHTNEVIKTSFLTKKGRLSFVSYLGHSTVLSLITLLLLAAVFAVNAVISGSGFNIESLSNPTPILVIGMGVIYIGMFWIAICQMIKRLHDNNFNGWWVLLAFVLIGIILLCIPGKERSNRFGAWRQTRLWEKVLAVPYVLIFFASVILPFATYIMGLTG